jgi:hypothetical protein
MSSNHFVIPFLFSCQFHVGPIAPLDCPLETWKWRFSKEIRARILNLAFDAQTRAEPWLQSSILWGPISVNNPTPSLDMFCALMPKRHHPIHSRFRS